MSILHLAHTFGSCFSSLTLPPPADVPAVALPAFPLPPAAMCLDLSAAAETAADELLPFCAGRDDRPPDPDLCTEE